ncbi:MAG: hypothetical protein V3U72_03975, partial [Candidatus Aenigmarchaeota archaeon]
MNTAIRNEGFTFAKIPITDGKLICEKINKNEIIVIEITIIPPVNELVIPIILYCSRVVIILWALYQKSGAG